MADLHIKKAGAWAPIATAHIKKAGAWAEAAKVYIKKAGAWVEVWSNWVVGVNTGARTSFADPAPPSGVGFEWRTDGTLYNDGGTQVNSSTDWIIPNGAASGDYEIRFTEVSADANWAYSSITPDGTTWYALSSQRNLKGGSTNGNDASCVVTAEIRFDGGAALDSANFTINANLLV
jgi:hypothetical protein